MSNIVGSKGQIVISKEIRERLGIQPGWIALQRLVGDHVEIYFVPPEHDRSLKGSLAEFVEANADVGDDWDRAREQAWAKAARDRMESQEQED